MQTLSREEILLSDDFAALVSHLRNNGLNEYRSLVLVAQRFGFFFSDHD